MPREPPVTNATRSASFIGNAALNAAYDPPRIGGIVAPTGKPGTVIMFHGNLVHASPANITPYPRKIVYLTLCAVSNHITEFKREEWIAHRDFTPIKACDDNALIEFAKRYKQAAE